MTLETIAAMEPVYQYLFTREIARLDELDDYYPVRAAANYSLLYLILRIAKELNPKSVLDMGSGESSLLLGRLRKRGMIGGVLTVEHDERWAAVTREKIDHELLVSPLVKRTINTHTILTYDWDAIKSRGPFDFVICDGPGGTDHFSRYGVVSLLTPDLPEDFVIIMDDSNRNGERETVKAMESILSTMNRRFLRQDTIARKRQSTFAGGRYIGAVHF